MPLSVPSLLQRTSPLRRFVSSLTRLPAELSRCRGQAHSAPEEDDGQGSEVRPDRLVPHHHVARELREVGERQDVRDRAQERRVALGREERARDDRPRQKKESSTPPPPPRRREQ